MYGEVIFRIKVTVSVHDNFIVFLDSKFETQSLINETRDTILESFENGELSLVQVSVNLLLSGTVVNHQFSNGQSVCESINH